MISVFETINNYFDKIYVLTLRRATERQDNIKTNLEGLNFSFFYGADKNDFNIDDLEMQKKYDSKKAIKLQRYAKPMTAGQIGCAWSHKLIYEDIVKNNFSKVLILEDDVLIIDNKISLFEKIVSELPHNWELLYFDYHKNTHNNIFTFIKKQVYHLQKLFVGMSWTHNTISNLYPTKYSMYLNKSGFHMYTSAYAITNTAAQKLIDVQTPIAHVADHLLAHCITNKIINGFNSSPKLFEQESQDKSKAIISYVD